LIEISDVETEGDLIAGHVVHTPTVPSPGLSTLLGDP
jgi:threonine dehydratase